MREEMQKANLPEPEFEILRGTFKVTFRKENSAISGKITTQKTTHKIILKDINETQLKILGILKENPSITQKQIAEITNLTRDGVKYNISILKKFNIIKRVGSDRKGYWKIIQ